MSRSGSALDRVVGLKEEVLVIGRHDRFIHHCSWFGVAVEYVFAVLVLS